MMFNPLGALVLAGITLAASAAAGAADLKVTVTDLKSDQGRVLVALYNDRAAFPDKMLAGQRSAAKAGSVTVLFTGLPPGTYAVSAFHDLDDNGRLNRSMIGIPTEPYGFSRDARGRTGPPSFDDAKFDLGAGGAEIVVRVR